MQSPIENIVSGRGKKKGIVCFDQMKVISSKIEKHSPSVLMVTSIPAGKSVGMIAAELAVATALQGKKVLLVEVDLKKPSLHEWFQMNQPAREDPLATIHPTFIQELDVVVANNPLGKPIDILLSPSFEEQVISWQESYDRVIFSAPSLYSGVEMELLADQCREAVLVLQRKDRAKDIRLVQGKLEAAGCNIIGAVYQR
jgi:protein-tyrosine kinase